MLEKSAEKFYFRQYYKIQIERSPEDFIQILFWAVSNPAKTSQPSKKLVHVDNLQ